MHSSLIFTALVGILARIVSADENGDALKPTPTATISNGTIIGTTTSIPGPTSAIPVNKFLGIPYAAKAVRFSPPQPHAAWTTALNTQKYGNACMQAFPPVALRPFTESVFSDDPKPNEDEDCLFINVYAPKKQWDPNNPFPVMYWIYGGAWKFGDTSQRWYDGSHFAALEDVVVVSVNYRTNAFGFPISPSVPLNQRNLGMLDQRFGLQWVQDNIRHFGGDPDKVTVFGESAGGFATDALVTSNAPNFHAAIMESGVYAYLLAGPCDNNNFNAWNALVQALNCSSGDQTAQFNCVKNDRTQQQIKDAQEAGNGITFGFACDEVTLVSNPRTRLENGQTKNIPVILGSNTADGSLYSWTTFANNNTTAYVNARLSGNRTIQAGIERVYPIPQPGGPDNATILGSVDTDWFFHCPGYWYGLTSTKSKPTWRYIFNAEFKNTRARVPSGWTWPEQYQRAWHSSEIPIVFTSYDAPTAESTQNTLSNTMRHAWGYFARNHAPPSELNWPQVGKGSGGKDVIEFGTDKKAGVSIVEDVDHCDFWESMGFKNFHA